MKVATPGAVDALDNIGEADGIDEFGARLQAYVTGNTTSQLIKKCKKGQ